ncbi:hypothetical protein ACV357_36030, partial [Pseudomonas aeruginosa]
PHLSPQQKRHGLACYHGKSGTPNRREAAATPQEHQKLSELGKNFPLSSGQIWKVGYKMRAPRDTYVINPMKKPVYYCILGEN